MILIIDMYSKQCLKNDIFDWSSDALLIWYLQQMHICVICQKILPGDKIMKKKDCKYFHHAEFYSFQFEKN